MDHAEYCLQYQVFGDPTLIWRECLDTIGWPLSLCRKERDRRNLSSEGRNAYRVAIRITGDWCECAEGEA